MTHRAVAQQKEPPEPSKFGNTLRSKTRTAQINEALCKILCHNICCLIQSMYELNLKPKFWKEVA